MIGFLKRAALVVAVVGGLAGAAETAQGGGLAGVAASGGGEEVLFEGGAAGASGLVLSRTDGYAPHPYVHYYYLDYQTGYVYNYDSKEWMAGTWSQNAVQPGKWDFTYVPR